MKKYIAVAGNIGSGKTKLIEFLCSSYHLVSCRNPAADNPYIAKFYQDMRRWSFHTQIYTLTRRFSDLQKLSATYQSVIQSRTIHEDAEIFARNLYKSGYMNETDFMTYYEFYKSLAAIIPAPDLLIYLHSSVSASRKRLQADPDAYGNLITNKYLKQLNRLYVNWIADYDLSEVVIIDTDQLDVSTSLVDQVDILESIERFI